MEHISDCPSYSSNHGYATANSAHSIALLGRHQGRYGLTGEYAGFDTSFCMSYVQSYRCPYLACSPHPR